MVSKKSDEILVDQVNHVDPYYFSDLHVTVIVDHYYTLSSDSYVIFFILEIISISNTDNIDTL